MGKGRLETKVWQRLREQCGALGRFTRIESGVGEGIPDVNYCIETIEGWIELKSAETTARDSSLFLSGTELRDEQVTWHLLQHRAGGRSYVLTARGDEVFVHEGYVVEALQRASLAQARVLARSVFAYRDAWARNLLPIIVGRRVSR